MKSLQTTTEDPSRKKLLETTIKVINCDSKSRISSQWSCRGLISVSTFSSTVDYAENSEWRRRMSNVSELFLPMSQPMGSWTLFFNFIRFTIIYYKVFWWIKVFIPFSFNILNLDVKRVQLKRYIFGGWEEFKKLQSKFAIPTERQRGKIECWVTYVIIRFCLCCSSYFFFLKYLFCRKYTLRDSWWWVMLFWVPPLHWLIHSRSSVVSGMGHERTSYCASHSC